MTEKRAPGQLLGSYTIVRHIGSGEFANVYEVENKKKELFAAKVYKDEWSDDFEEELSVVKYVPKHTCFGFYADSIQTNQMNVLILNHCGTSLKQMLDKKEAHRLSSLNSIKVGLKLIDAVEILHDSGWIHRDLHPGNATAYLSNGVPVVSIVDFGLSTKSEGERVNFYKRLDVQDIIEIALQCTGVKRSAFHSSEDSDSSGEGIEKEKEVMSVEFESIWETYKKMKLEPSNPVDYSYVRNTFKAVFPDTDMDAPITFKMTNEGILLD